MTIYNAAQKIEVMKNVNNLVANLYEYNSGVADGASSSAK